MGGTGVVLALPARLDLGSVRAVKNELSAHTDEDLVLTAANVEWIGGLGVQLLLAARKAWLGRGLRFEVQDGSEAYRHGVTQLGAADLAPGGKS